MTYKDQYKHPEWQKKRLEVFEANTFKCQECSDTETTLHVHHPEYRPGAKVWEYEAKELMCLCEKCHEKEHGLYVQPQRKIYFAGKISKNDWRTTFYQSGKYEDPLNWGHVKTSFGYATGPFFVSCDHGCAHYPTSHGSDGEGLLNCTQEFFEQHGADHRAQIYRNCLSAILQSDAVFVWIDELTCYGTMLEIGYAIGKNIPVYIGVDVKLSSETRAHKEDLAEGQQIVSDELWFYKQAVTGFGYYDDHREAFTQFFA